MAADRTAAQDRDMDDFARVCRDDPERETLHLDGCVLWGGHDGPCLLEDDVNADHGEAGKRVPCGCKVSCGDVAESDDKPNAVCKGLPFPRAES